MEYNSAKNAYNSPDNAPDNTTDTGLKAKPASEASSEAGPEVFSEAGSEVGMETASKAISGENKRDVLICRIVENDLPDDIGITAEEYEYAGWQFLTGMAEYGKKLSLARKCFEAAVRKGNPKAMMYLAEFSMQDGDLEGYYRWILEAALTGDVPEAYMRLGLLYYDSGIVTSNYGKAYRYMELAAEGGANGANFFLGVYTERGLVGEPDLEKAIKYYRQGAQQYDERCWESLKSLGIDFQV